MQAKLTMNCVDPATLFDVLSVSGSDVLVPVVLPRTMFLEADIRGLMEELEWQNKTPMLFASIIAVSCLGQYSLAKDSSLVAVSRINGYLREATLGEAQDDFNHFSEQVMGEKVTKDNRPMKYRATINFCDTKYFYTGPMRLERVIHTLWVREEENLSKDLLLKMVEGVNEIVEPAKDDEEKSSDSYFVIVAKKGKVLLGQFEKPEELDLGNLQTIGQLEMQGGRLLCYTEEDPGNPLDFSKSIYKF